MRRMEVSLQYVEERIKGEEVVQKGRTTFFAAEENKETDDIRRKVGFLKKHFYKRFCMSAFFAGSRVVLSSVYRLAWIK